MSRLLTEKLSAFKRMGYTGRLQSMEEQYWRDVPSVYDGALDSFRGGSFDVNDLGTTASPISIPGTGVFTKLTNDGSGAQTTSVNSPLGMTELWDTTDDEFDFSQLKAGDIVDIRIDLDIITSSPNTQVHVRMEAGLGVFPFVVGWDNAFYEAADTHPLVRSSFIAMQTSTILTGTAEFQLSSSKACTVVVNGWNYVVRIRG